MTKTKLKQNIKRPGRVSPSTTPSSKMHSQDASEARLNDILNIVAQLGSEASAYRKYISSIVLDKHTAQKMLQDTGAYDKNGELTSEYRIAL